MRLVNAALIVGIYGLSASQAGAHGGHDHGHSHEHDHEHSHDHGGGHHQDDDIPSNTPQKSSEEVSAALTKIAESYQKNVHSIFQQKCFDCHTSNTKYPVYYGIPGIKQMINRDIEKGRKRLDMSNGFPFTGHGTPRNHLNEIMEVMQEDCMPPLMYRTVHGAKLTSEEKKIIEAWVNEGRGVL